MNEGKQAEYAMRKQANVANFSEASFELKGQSGGPRGVWMRMLP
jgi:hypothetical protein